MHLVSRTNITEYVDGEPLRLAVNERIHTENSYKYSIDSFRSLAQNAGFELAKTWVDADQLFSVHYLSARKDPK